jgi:hypothetical protein
LYAQGFFVLHFLFKRVDAVSDTSAHFAGYIASFGKRYFRIASQSHIAAVNDGFAVAVYSGSDDDA